MTLKEMLETASERFGSKTAIVCGDKRISYKELNDDANRMANALKKLGITRGDRVALLLGNSPEFIISYFGTVKLGATAVPLDTKYKLEELVGLFEDCRPKALVADKKPLETIAPALPRLNYVEHVICTDAAEDSTFTSFEHFIKDASSESPQDSAKPNDIAHIAYTSGPTLRPRGVMLVQKHLASGASVSAIGFNQTDEDVVTMFALPMHHAVGMVVIMLTAIHCGSKVIMISGLSIPGLLKTIEEERATIFMGVPFVHALLLREIETQGLEYDTSSLRICASAGAPLPLDIIQRYPLVMGHNLIQFYGLTEATVHVTCQPANGNVPTGSVGTALPGFQLKIIDDEGRQLGVNEAGEIAIKGPVMKGYYNNPTATAEALKDGWLLTGDIGRIDEEGRVYILALKKPMLISKGQNIYHSDIEDVISTHPSVADVAVCGLPDPDNMRGDMAAAAVCLKPEEEATESQLRKLCLSRMANYKTPKHILFVDCLPKDKNGNIQLETLRDTLSSLVSGDKMPQDNPK